MRRWIILVVAGVLACTGTTVASASAAAKSSGGHAGQPITGKHRVARHVFYSTNWSGYAAHGTTFKSVTGTWVEPAADCSAVNGQKETVAAFFAGLDGFNSGTVEQTGVDAICIGKTDYYIPWYEFYPARSFTIDHTVQPGDTLTSTVSHDSTNVTVMLHDQTQGWTNTASAPAAGLAFSSAEWIAESPTHLLTNFGTVHFSSASATNSANHSGPINDGAWSSDEIILVSHNGRTVRADPGALLSGGSSFDDVWHAY